jgi:capsular exopolysaccharide synthesis family protein
VPEAMHSKSSAEAERETGGVNLSAFSEGLITILDPTAAAAEAYRALRTSLSYGVNPPPKTILVTSPGSAEGKSTVCANLGVVLAQASKRTLIIDCDLRRAALHKIFGLGNTRGLVDCIVARYSLQELYQEPVPGLGLKVLPAGALPPNPSEVLDSWHLSQLLVEVREEFDYVLLDSPPLGLVTDPAILAARADGILLVLDARKTSKEAVRQATRCLRDIEANIIGTVTNNTLNSSA